LITVAGSRPLGAPWVSLGSEDTLEPGVSVHYSMITVTSAHHRCLVYHILLVALEVFPWSEELASRPFHGWLCSRLERFLAVVDSSSVLLDGPSKPCIPHLELELELELTWLSIPPAPGVNTLSTVSPVILVLALCLSLLLL